MNAPHNENVLGMSIVPSVQREKWTASFGVELDNLITSATTLLQRSYPQREFHPEAGLIRQLQDIIPFESNALRKHSLNALVNAFKAYFNLSDPDKPETLDGQVKVFVSSDKLFALLVITPPRAQGNMPTMNMAQSAIEQSGITRLDMSLVDKAIETVRDFRDVIWCLPIARGEPPQAAKLGRIEFSAPVIDKNLLFANPESAAELLTPLWDPVPAGKKIGSLLDSNPGAAGIDVYGRPIPPPESEMDVEFSADIEVKPTGALIARNPGYITRDERRVEILPMYVVKAAGRDRLGRLSFPGMVFSPGPLKGPGEIECDDLIILGNCEQLKVSCRNDVFVTGGIIGRQTASVDADGRVFASFISEAKISAMRDVTAANAIVNSNVISNTRIRVTSEKGMIAGGKLCALQEITAATIGSEFGMLTETVVGKDFLSSSRMADIMKRIELHEDNLRKIKELKSTLARSRMRIEQMSPEKQEIFLGVLRKEQSSINELRSLERRRENLSRALRDFLDAGIRILNQLYPPVRAQIGDAVKEISDRLEAVTFKYDPMLGIVSDGAQEKKGIGNEH